MEPIVEYENDAILHNKVIGISFCVYGTHVKYLKGLEENLKVINEKLPNYRVYIYMGNDVPDEYYHIYSSYKNVTIMKIDKNGTVGAELMMYRSFTLDYYSDVYISFSRDIDSLINDRDIWTMNEFIQSDKLFHVVRDHYWHKMRIMGGTFGMKRNNIISIKKEYWSWKENSNIEDLTYATDEKFLQEKVYDIIKNCVLIHSNIVGYLGEHIHGITKNLLDEYDFIGNVVDYDENMNKFFKFKYYEFPLVEHFHFLVAQEQWQLFIKLYEETSLHTIKPESGILFPMYMGYYYTNQFLKCIDILKKYEFLTIDEALLFNSNYLFSKLGKKIVATTNIKRQPNEDEIIVYYGNYLHDINNLPISNKVFRHPKYFCNIHHDLIEFHESWNNIDVIYILNLEERGDRYLEILVELCKMGCPLQKIYHYKAKKEIVTTDKEVDTYIGAAKNHINVIEHFINNNYNHCLILEDDITFTNNIEEHQTNLNLFFERKYDFDVCFISSSKYGPFDEYDDLLRISKQPCTTSSGYILNKSRADKVLNIIKEGNDLLLETGNHRVYANDRYWAKIQDDNKMFIFNNKFGYQRPSYSSITQKFSCHFD
jgi:hypothetical protein